MIKSSISISACIAVCFVLGCNNDVTVNTEKEKQINGFTIKGKFTTEGYITGEAKAYDAEGVLRNKSNYENGVRNGLSVNFFKNGATSDSLFFIANKEYGYWYRFDSLGNPLFVNNFYYGLTVGPEFYYSKGQLYKYIFIDFNKVDIASADYIDGRLKDISLFKMSPVIRQGVKDGKANRVLFVYLPVIPKTEQKFTIGITNASHQDKELGVIIPNKVFLDTVLSIPEKGWHYYIASHIKANNDSLNKYFIEEAEDD